MAYSSPIERNREAKGLPRRERRNLQQREEILDAALKLFSKKRYHNVAIQEIAKKAEIGIGTFYKFFNNKEELYNAIIMRAAKKWRNSLMDVLEQEQNPIQIINKYIAVRRKLFSDNLAVMRLYYAETRGASFNTRAGLDQDLINFYDEGIRKLASVFERGVKQHVFRELDPYQMAVALDGIINAILFRMMEDPARFRKGNNLSTVTDIFFSGVLNK